MPSPRGLSADPRDNILTYKFTRKLAKRFYEDAGLTAAGARRERAQRFLEHTDQKVKKLRHQMDNDAKMIARIGRQLETKQKTDLRRCRRRCAATVVQTAARRKLARWRRRARIELRAMATLTLYDAARGSSFDESRRRRRG